MDNFRGILLMVAAMAGFAVEDMFIKRAAETLPVGQILLILGFGASTIFSVMALRRGQRLFSRSLLSRPVMLRNGGEVVGTFGLVTAIALTPISSASAILQATPLVVTLGAALFLGEQVGWRRWSAIAVGLAGVLLVIRPGLEGFRPASLFALFGVFGLATRDLATRATPRSVSSLQLSAYGFAMLVPLGAALLIIAAPPQPVSAVNGARLAGAIAMGAVSYYALVEAMRVGDVSVITPFRYSRLLFALIIGTLAFGERPDAMTLIGSAVIIGSGLYTFARERALSSRRKGR
ncbi:MULTISPECIES: DMT family transporter [Actibacterium]|uniref:Drug/metabolite transporter (DMT)-like permease n=1 Tax=Actibacterium naphthalenivorans TaxID=1614693 RepID=A0A840CAF7_9RHOB|nr:MULTISPECIES: DMT family transporter [Actibacterium]ALG90181.1 membrane protein [Actibacterium sp. EMB200-NS6]MBB4022070.1 drug/metabolite transporter (DMT)-like permease [Actibacterium naphthalenivorans]